LGSGNERFEAAAETLMSWGVQRGSGMRVENIELAPSSEIEYNGLIYDEGGNPIAPREVDEGYTYLEDGTPQVAPGVSADLVVTVAGFRFTAPVRVVSVTTDVNRVGFAYGTLHGHPVQGEESFIVERHPNGSVWAVIRSFSKPGSWYFSLGAPLLRWQQRRFIKRYLQALLPGRSSAKG